MKNKVLLTMAVVALTNLSACKKDASQKTNKKLGKFIQESSLLSSSFCLLTAGEHALHFGLERSADSNLYVFTKSQLDSGIANFHNIYKYSDSGLIRNLDSSKQQLSIDNLMQLYSVIQSDSSVDYDRDTNYSALRLTFGMEGKRIILIYEPIVLKHTGLPKECAVVSTNTYFRVNSLGDFVSINSVDFAALVSNLRNLGSKIHITHPNNPSVYNFISASDSSSDVMSNIISFQQITKMYCDNNQGEYFSDKINFSIVANRNISLTNNYRMHVVANFRTGLSTPITGTYRNYAADYAHLCPITCGVIKINYYY